MDLLWIIKLPLILASLKAYSPKGKSEIRGDWVAAFLGMLTGFVSASLLENWILPLLLVNYIFSAWWNRPKMELGPRWFTKIAMFLWGLEVVWFGIQVWLITQQIF